MCVYDYFFIHCYYYELDFGGSPVRGELGGGEVLKRRRARAIGGNRWDTKKNSLDRRVESP